MRHKKKLIALAVLVLGPVVAHGAIQVGTRIEPPALGPAGAEAAVGADGTRRLDGGAVRRRGKVLEVRLAGAPEAIGHQHGRLLYPEMVANEGQLLGEFRHHVPFAPARWLIMDMSRLQFRGVDQGMADARRHEVAAQARAFSPDPYADLLPTYHRFVFLQSLYDIALSFEHSPLIGCTSFTLGGEEAAPGHTILARNFDFEAGPVFDEGKAVFLVREEGRIPYASVAWPGFVGAVSGMNAAGVAAVVHGARAGEPRTRGEPVVHTLREVLARAHSTEEALAVLDGAAPMVSHMVMVADASGDVAIAERVPGAAMHVRRGRGKVPLTNHLEGPFAGDPDNQRVERSTSTWPRRKRLDELLANLPAGASVQEAVRVLRDKRGVGDAELPLGDRRAIDALIATHAVVMDVTARELWVSEGPHLVGRFVRFDLGRLFDPPAGAAGWDEVVTLPEDAIAGDGSYAAWVGRGSPHAFDEGKSAAPEHASEERR
ncbi:MAG: C45 family peptidase [Polyangiaceae bacterium]